MPKLYFCLGGKSSAEVGLRQLQPIRYSAPKPVYTRVDIPGRSGPLLIHTGAYEPVTASTECCIMRTPSVDRAIASANAFLLSTLGYQRLEDPLCPNVYRMASVTVGAEYYRAAPNYAPFTVELLCKPQCWLKSGEQTVTISASGGVLHNPTSFSSKPLITVYGSGEATLTVNGTAAAFTALESHCTLDSDTENAYRGTLNENENVKITEFPTLAPGDNVVAWTGGITKVEIIPRWWCL